MARKTWAEMQEIVKVEVAKQAKWYGNTPGADRALYAFEDGMQKAIAILVQQGIVAGPELRPYK